MGVGYAAIICGIAFFFFYLTKKSFWYIIIADKRSSGLAVQLERLNATSSSRKRRNKKWQVNLER
ncbi:MAG TPA: hypothetical protein DCG34_05835 [Clostridiales bacterium]|nr:hypothetical protein [Clostridiales bacterium]